MPDEIQQATRRWAYPAGACATIAMRSLTRTTSRAQTGCVPEHFTAAADDTEPVRLIAVRAKRRTT